MIIAFIFLMSTVLLLAPGSEVKAQQESILMPNIKVEPIPLDSNDLSFKQLGKLTYRGGVKIIPNDTLFRGFSGILISPNGKDLIAVGYGAKWMRGSVSYDTNGNLSGFSVDTVIVLQGLDGKPIKEKKDRDAECLTYDGNYYYVGFEENTRIWRYKNLYGKAEEVALPDEALKNEWFNPGAGFSSVAAIKNGTVLAFLEGCWDLNYNTKGSYISDSLKEVIWFKSSWPYLLVDLAPLPNGDLISLQVTRVYSEKYDHTRISRVGFNQDDLSKVLNPETLGIIKAPMTTAAKYESVTSRLGPDNEVYIYLMSDTWEGATNLLMFELK